ncbi:MAG: hypothetical protein R2766_04835 [Saprospiraceae bacterium]
MLCINSTSICGGPYKNKAELLQAIQDLEADISNVENNGIISLHIKRTCWHYISDA